MLDLILLWFPTNRTSSQYQSSLGEPVLLTIPCQETIWDTMNFDTKMLFGNFEPWSFVMSPCIPGTVNIHPSLLPLYRGAAPVQRALQVCMMHLLQFWAGQITTYTKLSTMSVGWCCRNRCFPCIYCPCLGCRSSDCLRKVFCRWMHQGR